MKTVTRPRLALLAPAIALLLQAWPAPAQPGGDTPGVGMQPLEFPIYVPPSIDAPRVRVDGGTRGAPLTTLKVLAPDHIALTTRTQPTLYWYLAQDTSHPVEFTIRTQDGVEALAEVTLEKAGTRGIHAIRLADHGVTLRPDTDYRWFVVVVPSAESRSHDVLASAVIRHVEPSAAVEERLRAAGSGREAFVFAEGGIWYDALDSLSTRIVSSPGERRLRAQRAALLDQVGIDSAASYDRSAPGE